MSAHEADTPEVDLRPDQPHSARFWTYLLGGKEFFPADKALGEYVQEHHPVVVSAARGSRNFLGRTVRFLAEEAGIRQYLDIGSGLPTTDNTHEVAQRSAPESRVVYVDNDPIVLLHSQALLTSSTEGEAAYVHADIHDPDTIFAQAVATLDFTKPVALILLSMLGHIADADEAAKLVQTYMSRLAPGSYLVVCDSIDSPEMLAAQRSYAEGGAVPYIVRTREQIAATAKGLELLEPGLVPVTQWRPTQEEEALSVDQYGLVARKA
jgi:hypothetical protein